MPKFAIAFVSLLLGAEVATAWDAREKAGAPNDAVSVDAIVSELYASVSHAAGTAPDFDRLRRIFHSSGKLVPPKAPEASDFRAMTVDQFAERIEKFVADRKAKGQPSPVSSSARSRGEPIASETSATSFRRTSRAIPRPTRRRSSAGSTPSSSSTTASGGGSRP